MTRLLALATATAVVALAAACSALDQETQRVDDAPPPWTPRPKPSVPDRGQSPGLFPVRSGRINALVTVVDGDTGRRIHGARVVIGKRAGYANRRGLAYVRVQRPAPLEVRVSKPGYGTRTVRLPLQRNRRGTIRLYRTDLQWPVYGANPQRTNAHLGIRLRPPFRVVWSRGLGSLVEFPAVVHEGVAFVGNYKGTIYAIEMRRGRVVWRYDPPGGKMASSPAVVGEDVVVHGMDGIVRVLNRRNGRLRWQHSVGSPIESSPLVAGGVDYFGAWNGRIYALDLRRRAIRWSYATGAKVTSSAALHRGTLYIGDYA
ncbi:MAG TPA: PQQ-binding-like beta-propeller repeat protein, partial [Gaiellaceae bacterium]|nr:PQQ-binding-like beta-propeller repeat protein [Gaiellaceae bacterium]